MTAGCRSIKYVPVERVTHTTDTIERVVRVIESDTIREKEYISELHYDSVAPILDSLNRVIGFDRYHFREVTKMNDRERKSLLATIDSLRKARVDSVYVEKPYPVEVTKEVNHKQTFWQRFRQGIVDGCIAILIVGAMVLSLRRIYRNRKSNS